MAVAASPLLRRLGCWMFHNVLLPRSRVLCTDPGARRLEHTAASELRYLLQFTPLGGLTVCPLGNNEVEKVLSLQGQNQNGVPLILCIPQTTTTLAQCCQIDAE